MDITIIQEQSDLVISTASTKTLVGNFLQFHHILCDEVAIHFVTTPVICQLHTEFFNDPSPTDCITFPMDDIEEDSDYRVLGEVFVCPQTAIDYINEHGGDAYHEATLYVVHGLLHLLGFDDIDEEDELLMRHEERRYLEHVAKKNLWLHA